ncbi:type 1 glutamine amidotransferase domain-containing protein [Bifidobacterium jacchi]|uniref:Type 1 glutamine amidotransferase n=1 Tax=Bifidobacterium jacchi TaxID=2490545 RepID=A0A5N5RIB3_9BIFI|nr:type 1 glutamine amidotransferase domain-containing protein [Bifidobacterium jacchi]KAB5606987.1 type 1 glutamine amidotransferase [Bifidobacterium jacchi]
MAVKDAKVLIIVNNWGIEETELTRPLRDLKAAGADVTLAATTLDPCETVEHDRYEGETLTPDAKMSDVQAADYDLLVVPGGTCNVDRVRVNEDAITLAQEFAHEGKPIAAICHGAWLLVNADLVEGKTLSPCRYIAADIENAGGHYVDEQLTVDDENGWRLITSRKPADLDAFVGAIKDTLEA